MADLVSIPSVNPSLPCQDARLTGEQPVADFLQGQARKAGLEAELQPILPGRANLLVRLRPQGRARRRVLLAPHLDTVDAPESSFRPVIKAGRLYGRGSVDTKASVAAMFSALCRLAKAGPRPLTTEIVFAGLIDEENEQLGSRFLASCGCRADLAIVGEPTDLKVVTAHKGNLWVYIETRGRAAHGSTPHLGRNAVHLAAKIVELVETRYALALGKKRHPLLGSPTVNVGFIQGGTQPNIVPDRCRVGIDRRTVPGETDALVLRELRSLLRSQGIRASISSAKAAPCWPLETSSDLPLVRRFLNAVGQSEPVGVDYFCDASILAHARIPSVVFGPGSIAQAHTADEWVSLASVESAERLLTRFLSELD